MVQGVQFHLKYPFHCVSLTEQQLAYDMFSFIYQTICVKQKYSCELF